MSACDTGWDPTRRQVLGVMDEAGAEHDNSPSGPCMLLFISDLRVSLPWPRT